MQGDKWLRHVFGITWLEVQLEGRADVERVPVLHGADEVKEVLQPLTRSAPRVVAGSRWL